MFQVRTDEPDYTFLKDPETEQCNRYGQLIDLAELSGQPRGVSLRINGDEGVGANPNRYKQHASISPPTTASAAMPARPHAVKKTTCRRI